VLTIKPFNLVKSNLPVLIARLNDLLDSDDPDNWQVLIKKRADSRSVEQNARLWSLYTSIGNYLGYDAEEMHQLLKYKFLLEEKWIGKEKIINLKSTSKLNVKEMSEYMDKVCAFAGNLGWVDDNGF
jgi:hypothetical protein